MFDDIVSIHAIKNRLEVSPVPTFRCEKCLTDCGKELTSWDTLDFLMVCRSLVF